MVIGYRLLVIETSAFSPQPSLTSVRMDERSDNFFNFFNSYN